MRPAQEPGRGDEAMSVRFWFRQLNSERITAAPIWSRVQGTRMNSVRRVPAQGGLSPCIPSPLPCPVPDQSTVIQTSGRLEGSCDFEVGTRTADSVISNSGRNAEVGLLRICYDVLGHTLWGYKSANDLVNDTIEKLKLGIAGTSTNALRALQTLIKLSAFPEVQEMMFERLEGVLHKYLTEESPSGEMKELCLEVIRNLSRCSSNRISIYSTFGHPLATCLTHGETESIRRFAIGAVNNIATSELVALELVRTPFFLDTVVSLIKTGATTTIKERAMWTLQSLACTDENEIALFNNASIVQTLIDCLDQMETSEEMQSYAMETLQNLASRNRNRMFSNLGLMHGLLDMASHGRNPRLRSLALSCLDRIGLDNAKVNILHVLTGLASVTIVPRLSLMQCYIRILPNDLIRKIGDILSA